MTQLPPGDAAPIDFPVPVPFVDHLGIAMHAFADGRAELRIDLAAQHLNTWHVAHGGVVMTMLDVAMAMAARSAHPSRHGVATIEMKTTFMRPAQGSLRAVGQHLHGTATMSFCEARLYDDRSRLCATATGTFKFLRGLVSGAAAPPAKAESVATTAAAAAAAQSAPTPTEKGNP